MNNRISGCAEYYLKKGEDQIITKRVSTVSGKRDVSINGGDVENKGWEFTLNGTPIKTKNFTWGLSLNMYQNYNKVTSKNQTQTYDYKDRTETGTNRHHRRFCHCNRCMRRNQCGRSADLGWYNLCSKP